MTTWNPRANELFLRARELHSPGERRGYLDGACAGDPALRAEVEGLLEADARAGPFLEGPAPHLVATAEEPALAERPGTAVGPYRLLEQLGEGAFGIVFLAEQVQPVRRRVALKVLKPGMDTRQVVARFEAERQALALMDHPNIARVFDGGETASGRPYFALELVRGAPITAFCDQNRLGVRERLGLFADVCRAVQHAHQKGIIHRDIKPSNVLVAPQDGTPVVKVIDFGVAKALGLELTDKTVFTALAQMVGTPLYMSPEQAGQSGLDIDTRSDVYSLGVLLYELLTGTTPFDQERLRAAAYDELRRIIREEEPARPSARVGTLGPAAAAVSARRQSEPRRLSQSLRGDLDWVVMKCLEKDRNRRYDTAVGLARDVERYLHDEPVAASPPSAWYRFRKFARRNQTALTVAGLLLCCAAALAGGAAWVVRDRAARQARAANDLELALDRAELFQGQGKRAEALAAFDRAASLAAEAPAGPAQSARLAALKERLDAEARDQEFLDRFDDIRLRVESGVNVEENHFTSDAALPEIRDALRRYGIEIGVTPPAEAAAHLARPEPVRGYLVAALDECLRQVPPGDARTRQWLLDALGAADDDPWRQQVRKAGAGRDGKALEQLARAGDVGQQPPSFLLFLAHALPVRMKAARLDFLRRVQRAYPGDFWANHDLAAELAGNGRPAEAVRYHTAALALRPKNPGVLVNRGQALRAAGELDAAVADFRQAIDLAPGYAAAHFDLAQVLLLQQGHPDEAVAEYRAAIRARPDFALAHYLLGLTLGSQGHWDEALAELRETVRCKPDDPLAHFALGIFLRDRGRLDDAMVEYRAAIRLQKDHPGLPFNPSLPPGQIAVLAAGPAPNWPAAPHFDLGLALWQKGRLDEALAEYREAVRIKPDYAEARMALGNALRDTGRPDDALGEYREVLRLRPDHAEAHYNLGCALIGKGRPDDALAEFRAAIRVKPDYAEAHCNLGATLQARGRLDDAVAEFRAAIRLNKGLAVAHFGLGQALWHQRHLDEAIAEYREGIRLHKDYAEAHGNLGCLLKEAGRLDDAVAELREAIRLRPDNAAAHYNLGCVLRGLRRSDEAVAEYREAIRLKPDYAEPHCNLAHDLLQHGEFREARKEMRRGHELGSRNPHWPYPSAQWVRLCERLVELDEKLPGILEGKAVPSGPAERVELGALCCLKHRNRTAVRFYEEAFAADPHLADNPGDNRANAACAAALAGTGRGTDADKLDDPERARLRRQALDWLRADLQACGRLLDQGPDKARLAGQVLQRALANPDLAGVRGPEALARLPEAERRPWQQLWDDTAGMLARAQARPAPAKKADAK